MNQLSFVSLGAFAHFLVDAACCFLILSMDAVENPIMIFLVYNALAFVMQAPFGWCIDVFFRPNVAAVLGLILVAFAFVFYPNVGMVLLLTGIGNALFHVGVGALVLSIEHKKGFHIGLFVAPGAIGLAVGAFFASNFQESFWLFPLFLMLLAISLFFVRKPNFIHKKYFAENKDETEMSTGFGWTVVLALFILIPIVIRSTIGLTTGFPWKSDAFMGILSVSAVALGKFMGGYLSDKFGLIKIGVGGLLCSIPFLLLFKSIPPIGLVGLFLFNFTMPVTLLALMNLMPRFKGLSFGLTTAALFVGALPILLCYDEWLQNPLLRLRLLLLATLLLFVALMKLPRKTNSQGA